MFLEHLYFFHCSQWFNLMKHESNKVVSALCCYLGKDFRCCSKCFTVVIVCRRITRANKIWTISKSMCQIHKADNCQIILPLSCLSSVLQDGKWRNIELIVFWPQWNELTALLSHLNTPTHSVFVSRCTTTASVLQNKRIVTASYILLSCKYYNYRTSGKNVSPWLIYRCFPSNGVLILIVQSNRVKGLLTAFPSYINRNE